jgi:hypothetical protein
MPAGAAAGGRTEEAGASATNVNPVAAENSVPPAMRLIVTGRRHAKHIWNPSVIFVAAEIYSSVYVVISQSYSRDWTTG